jgi:predicted CXXCH cytochrome family protein
MRLLQVWLITGSVVLLAFSGCSPETRYETLNFFFDGVPVPGELKTGAKDRRRREPSDVPIFRKHGPYAAKMCEACHRQGGGDLIMPVEELCLNCHDLDLQKRKIHGPVAAGGCRVCHHPHGSGKAFMLVSEPADFCFFCHDKAEVLSRDTHKAAAGMTCTECHDPHSSDNDYMLR